MGPCDATDVTHDWDDWPTTNVNCWLEKAASYDRIELEERRRDIRSGWAPRPVIGRSARNPDPRPVLASRRMESRRHRGWARRKRRWQ